MSKSKRDHTTFFLKIMELVVADLRYADWHFSFIEDVSLNIEMKFQRT